nr:hypothetical protein [uncultured Flavonifractor sp.]
MGYDVSFHPIPPDEMGPWYFRGFSMEGNPGQFLTALFKYKKLILSEEENTSAGGCGVFLAAFYALRQPVQTAVPRRAFF